MDTILSGVGVLDKAMAIVSAIEPGPRSLGELVEVTGISRPTAHRLAAALEQHGVLRRDGDGRFALGVRLVALGRVAISQFHLAELAEPVLERLRDETGESAQLYVVEGDHRRCVVALDSPHELRTIVEPGQRLPLGSGSAGRLLAGQAPSKGGWIETVAEREQGVASVSAPVVGVGGELVAAISVSGPIDRIGRTPGRRHGVRVVDAAARLGRELARA
jgi:DNA-binding IclR family transcriptional regulator